MVCLDLHTQGQGKQGRTQNGLRQPFFQWGFLHFGRNDILVIPSALFVIPNVIFIIPSALFVITNVIFFIPSALFVIPSGAEGSHCRPVSEYHTCQNPREECDSLHLRIVTDLDYLHII